MNAYLLNRRVPGNENVRHVRHVRHVRQAVVDPLPSTNEVLMRIAMGPPRPRQAVRRTIASRFSARAV